MKTNTDRMDIELKERGVTTTTSEYKASLFIEKHKSEIDAGKIKIDDERYGPVTVCDILPPVNGVGFPNPKKEHKYIEKKVYICLRILLYYTAGHAEIYAQGDMTSVVQQELKSRIEELRTYQTQKGMMSLTSHKRELPTTNWRLRSLTDEARASIHLRFAFIPPINGVGFPAHIVKRIFITL